MIVDGRVVANRSPSAAMAATGRPQIAAARSTGHSSSRPDSSGQPTVWADVPAGNLSPVPVNANQMKRFYRVRR